jgi:nucleotide-binding universal stress UspA family protein
MKKILIVAMDFSEGAMNAFNFSIRVANAISANIMLVWVDKKKIGNSVYSNAFDPRLEVKKRFEALIEEYESRLVNGKFLYKMRNGKVHIEITNQAKYHDATLILAGTHGTSGLDEFWMGSNAQRIVANAECPVITLRHNESYDKPIRKILFPIDSTRETRQKLPFVSSLAKCLGAEITILSLYSTKVQSIRDFVDEYSLQVEEYLKERDINYVNESIEVENITNSTIEYAKNNDIDLISIMTEQESSPMNLLLGPYAQQMVNHSPIPVLSIRRKSIYDHQTK